MKKKVNKMKEEQQTATGKKLKQKIGNNIIIFAL